MGEGIKLDDLHIESGKWQYSRRLHEDFVAKSWGISLRDWYEMDEEIRAEHIAVYEVENQMQAYDQQEADRKSKAK